MPQTFAEGTDLDGLYDTLAKVIVSTAPQTALALADGWHHRPQQMAMSAPAKGSTLADHIQLGLIAGDFGLEDGFIAGKFYLTPLGAATARLANPDLARRDG